MAIFKNLRNLGKQMAAGCTPTPLTEEQLAALPPEQREAYEAALAEVAAGQRQLDAIYDSQMAARALHGPAGRHVYGADPRETAEATNQALATGGLAAYMKASWKASISWFVGCTIRRCMPSRRAWVVSWAMISCERQVKTVALGT